MGQGRYQVTTEWLDTIEALPVTPTKTMNTKVLLSEESLDRKVGRESYVANQWNLDFTKCDANCQ